MTIRRQPADFIVRERLSSEFSLALRPSGDVGRSEKNALCAVYRLEKTSLATPEAIHHAAKALGVRPERISYAGLKDKHAQTEQYLSVEPGAMNAGKPWPEEVRGPTWVAQLAGLSAIPVTAEVIDGNSFELVVRDLSRQASDEMARRADMLWVEGERAAGEPLGGGVLVVNYFGDQRFGGNRHQQGWAGRALIDGDFEGALRLAVGTPARKDAGKTRTFTRVAAGKWGDWKALAKELPMCPERRPFERLAAGADARSAFESLPYFTQQMAVEAYQSLLWNRTAALLAERLVTGRSGQVAERDVLVTEDPFGDMVFPVPRRVDASWRAMDLPLLSRKTELKPEWAWAVERVLKDEGLTQDGLRIPGLRRPFYGEAPRPLFVLAENFEMTRGERDEFDERGVRGKRVVKFDLPRGAYATVVLRALGQ